MLVLGIQTAAEPTQIALLEETSLLGERTIGERFAVCRELAPEIGAMLEECEKTARDIGLIGVCLGPGSFTGIRIGLATAKALAHSLARPIVGVNSLEVAAEGLDAIPAIVFLPAGRGGYFASAYGVDSRAPSLIRKEEVKDWFRDRDPATRVVCSVADDYLRECAERAGLEIVESPPRAETAGRLALRKLRSVGASNPLEIQPFYLRLSSPEERVGREVIHG